MMKKAAKDLDFIQAAQFRDELIRLQIYLMVNIDNYKNIM